MSRRAGTPTAKKVTQLVNVEEHVEGFRQVREAHRRELIDDYVELISDLIRKWGSSSGGHGCSSGVSQPTVAKMLKRLATMGLIEMILAWRVFNGRRREAGAGKPRATSDSRKFLVGVGRQSGNRPSRRGRYGAPC